MMTCHWLAGVGGSLIAERLLFSPATLPRVSLLCVFFVFSVGCPSNAAAWFSLSHDILVVGCILVFGGKRVTK